MSPIIPWTLFVLGFAHIIYGCIKYRTPLLEAIASGFIGKFGTPEVRRSAFWFIVVGPLLMLAGQVAIYAASIGDTHLIRIIAFYLHWGVGSWGLCFS